MNAFKSSVVTTRRLSWVLAGLLAAASVVGIIGGERFYGGYSASLAGLVGQDIYTLVVAVPALLLALWLVRRQLVAGPLLWIGSLFYVAYTYYFLVVGGFNALFPVYLAIVSIGLYGSVALVLAIDPGTVAARFGIQGHPRLVAALCISIAAFFIVMWGAMIAGAIAVGEPPDAVRHAVVAIDGSVMLPLLVIGGVGLWRRRPFGYVLGGLLLTKLTLTGFGLAFTTGLAWAWAGTLGPLDAFLLGVFGFMGLSGLALLVPFLRAVDDESGRHVTKAADRSSLSRTQTETA